MSQIRIPLSKQNITESDIQSVVQALRSDRLSGGEYLEKFEVEFARKVEAKYALATSSGTAALHLAVSALGLKEEEEVITTPFSFISSSNCILYQNARPVFVDIEEKTLGINPDLIKEAVNSRTVGILPVHIFGAPCNIHEISELADAKGLWLLEDNCEGLLSRSRGQLTGSFGDFSTYAFYPNKQMTTGEGGMLTTNDKELYDLAKSFRNQGRRDTSNIIQDRLGFNYRINELTASLGLSQLNQVDEFIRKRTDLAEKYISILKEVEGIRLLGPQNDDVHSWFTFVIRVDEKIRDEVITALDSEGIQAKAYFDPCIHLQPFYREKFGFDEGTYPVAEKVSKEVIALPFFTGMTESEITIVAESLVRIFS